MAPWQKVAMGKEFNRFGILWVDLYLDGKMLKAGGALSKKCPAIADCVAHICTTFSSIVCIFLSYWKWMIMTVFFFFYQEKKENFPQERWLLIIEINSPMSYINRYRLNKSPSNNVWEIMRHVGDGIICMRIFFLG